MFLRFADELISSAGSLTGLLRWDITDFERIKGIGKVKALQLSTQVEIAKRMMRGERTSDLRIDDPQKVWEYLYPEVRADSVEKVWILCLDRKNKLIRAESVTSGTATSSLVHPRGGISTGQFDLVPLPLFLPTITLAVTLPQVQLI